MKNLIKKLKIMTNMKADSLDKAQEELPEILKGRLSEEQLQQISDYLEKQQQAKASHKEPIKAPALPPMEMGAGALFAKLDSRRDVMSVEQRMVYDRLSRRFEEDGHTGLTLSWDDVNVLRRLYGTLFYSR